MPEDRYFEPGDPGRASANEPDVEGHAWATEEIGEDEKGRKERIRSGPERMSLDSERVMAHRPKGRAG
jgi:hypothetical protein